MMDFDNHANTYNQSLSRALGAFGVDTGYYAEHKMRIVRGVAPRDTIAVLEYGCGIGRNIGRLARVFPGSALAGCDISSASLTIARKNHPGCDFFTPEDVEIARRAGAFDLVLVANVFHHIPPEQRANVMRYIAEMMKKRGRIVVIEHNPINPLTRRIVRACEWDSNALLLPMRETVSLVLGARMALVQKRYTLFFPGPFRPLDFLDSVFGFIPLGGQYFVVGVKE